MELTIECTWCQKPCNWFEQWYYWPEDSGHEACLKEMEQITATALAEETPPKSLAELYAEEGGPPHRRWDPEDWAPALKEYVHHLLSETWHPVVEATLPNSPWAANLTTYPTVRPAANLATSQVIAEALPSWSQLEISGYAQGYGVATCKK